MRVGILGGGQLGRMLALEGYPLGLTPVFLEPKEDPCVSGLGTVIRGEYADADALRRFASDVDVVTYEFEKVPVASARALLESGVDVRPAPAALEMAQDRLAEKSGFLDLSIPTADFRPVDSLEDLADAADELGFPALLKTRFGGYDGKGQFRLKEAGDVERAWEALGGQPLLLEGFVEFERELSVISVRSGDGRFEFYPLAENEHEGGILRASVAPAPDVSADLRDRARGYARAVLDHLDYVGVAAIELFQVGGDLLANEMAPRVHNSGHWTLDGAIHSQFENHLRAVCGLPLGEAEPLGFSAMFNLLGQVPAPAELLAIPGVHLHLYDKAPRPLRKIGHVNVTGDDPDAVRKRLARVREVALTAPPGRGGRTAEVRAP